jgi:Ecdysteroid kinase-like family
MVVKLPSRTPEAEALAHALDLWNVESVAYRMVLPDVRIRTPHCWYNGADPATDRYALVLEDLSVMTPVDQVDGMGPDLTIRTIDWMAGLHGPFWGRGDEVTDLPACGETDQWVATAIQGFLPGYADRFAEMLPAGSIARVEKLIEAFGAGSLAATDTPTVIHGDLRGDNLMYSGEEVVAVDWQGARRGPGARDVSYVLTSSLDEQQRRDTERSLIARYHEKLIDAGAAAGSLNDTWESYRQGVAASMMIQVLRSGKSARTARQADFWSSSASTDRYLGARGRHERTTRSMESDHPRCTRNTRRSDRHRTYGVGDDAHPIRGSGRQNTDHGWQDRSADHRPNHCQTRTGMALDRRPSRVSFDDKSSRRFAARR